MYVCLCHAVTEKDLALLIKKGCISLSQLQKACGVGDSCGTCLQTAHKILLQQSSCISSKKCQKKVFCKDLKVVDSSSA